MALTKATVKRAVVAAGTDFLILNDGSTRAAQAVGLVDESGDHAGIAANPLVVTAAAPTGTAYTSGGTGVDSAVIAGAAAVLREIRVLLSTAVGVDRYLMLFNVASGTVADGTAPVWRVLVPAGGEASDTFSLGLDFDTGITAKISSTIDTLTVTADTAAFITALVE